MIEVLARQITCPRYGLKRPDLVFFGGSLNRYHHQVGFSHAGQGGIKSAPAPLDNYETYPSEREHKHHHDCD